MELPKTTYNHPENINTIQCNLKIHFVYDFYSASCCMTKLLSDSVDHVYLPGGHEVITCLAILPDILLLMQSWTCTETLGNFGITNLLFRNIQMHRSLTADNRILSALFVSLTRPKRIRALLVDVAVQFYPWFKYYFLFVLGYGNLW